MPHVRRCPECNLKLEFRREWPGVGAATGVDCGLWQDWACPSCGRIEVMEKLDWPPWFLRTHEEEQEWMQEAFKARRNVVGRRPGEHKKTVRSGMRREDRVGTILNDIDDDCIQIWQEDERGANKFRGTYSRRLRLYQFGVDLGKFVYWSSSARFPGVPAGEPAQPLQIGEREWNTIKDTVVRLEFIDEATNKLWVCDGDVARREGAWNDTKTGRKYGVPLRFWNVGQEKPRASEPSLFS